MGIRRNTTKASRMTLYAASKYLTTATREELGLRIPFDVYLQDPYVNKNDPKFGFDKDFFVNWEPGISDGPTSARFAVVDYNGDTGKIIPMAVWDEKQEAFLAPDKTILNRKNSDLPQFHQVNVWAVLQRALTFFEEGRGLGRRIPFGFEGNRLIVLPHAGYGKNAYYDRTSKSLQFYYFDQDDKRIYTCLSTDIINHEFGHAVLDGIRPYYFESSLVQTGAFHEFIGDLTATLIILRNNNFRAALALKTGGDLSMAHNLASLAEEFGNAVTDKPYLRTALNKLTMADISDTDGPHRVSQVLTGAMFDILIELTRHYIKQAHSPKEAFYFAIDRMQRTAIQPLDLLPPVDVTFRDYALAILRSEELSNPTDPHNYYEMMLNVFVKRKILNEKDRKTFLTPRYIYDSPDLDVYHDIGDISRSRATAYRFLDDNRNKLFIPANQDVIVADLYDANKYAHRASRLPRQIILEYIWREDVVLTGKRFGEFEGQNTTMLCGGTLVFDDKGNKLSWFRKPGSIGGGEGEKWKEEIKAGKKRLSEFLNDLAKRIQAGEVGAVLGGSKGMVGTMVPPLIVSKQDGILKFELSPHLSLSEEDHEHYKVGKQWQISS